jgi:hypothetical protein
MTERLAGKRILVTQADDYMGPDIIALFLASDESDFFVGQAIPFSGGWAQ